MKTKTELKEKLTDLHLNAEYQFALYLKGLASKSAHEMANGEFYGYRRALLDADLFEFDELAECTNYTVTITKG
jgi:hypothetical protein